MSKGQRTKERISEYSAKLFNTKGFHGTSIADIMEATQMEKGGIYNHFDNKEEIGLAAFDLCLVKILERFKKYYDADGDRKAKIHSLMEFYRSLWDDPVLEGNHPIFGLGMYASEINPELLFKVRQAFEKLEYIISVVLQEKQDEGNQDSSELVFSAINGSLFLSFYFNDSRYLYNTINQIEKLIK